MVFRIYRLSAFDSGFVLFWFLFFLLNWKLGQKVKKKKEKLKVN